MWIGNHDKPNKINLDGTEITISNSKKFHGVLIDKKLTFDIHIKSIYKKEGQKRSALARIISYFNLEQNLLLIDSVIKSQFSYCPLIWMFCLLFVNNPLNHIHERL